jgi:hypothetical protein
VSQAGWLEASHEARALACRRSDSACLDRASGPRAAIRPIRAACTRRSVAPSIAQFAQWLRSALIGFPQPPQTCSGFGCFTSGRSLPFTFRFFRWVRRVAISCRAGIDTDLGIDLHSSSATYSAVGATSLRTALVGRRFPGLKRQVRFLWRYSPLMVEIRGSTHDPVNE